MSINSVIILEIVESKRNKDFLLRCKFFPGERQNLLEEFILNALLYGSD